MNYQTYITGDGSPTLLLTREEDGYIEKMHNSKGAYAESLYIYGDVLSEALAWECPLTIGSLGLGLAYNEIISIARLGQREFKIISFEKNPLLTHEFLNWLNEKPSQFKDSYDWILKQTAKDHQLTSEQLKHQLKHSIETKQWEIRGEFPQDLHPKDQFHVFYYDAFSNKMSAELWVEDQLKDFIKKHTAAKCLLSTYAATGAMKRALKENGFALSPRPGFGGKRESILGKR